MCTTATFNLIHGQKDNSFLSGGLQSIAEEKQSEGKKGFNELTVKNVKCSKKNSLSPLLQ